MDCGGPKNPAPVRAKRSKKAGDGDEEPECNAESEISTGCSVDPTTASLEGVDVKQFSYGVVDELMQKAFSNCTRDEEKIAGAAADLTSDLKSVVSLVTTWLPAEESDDEFARMTHSFCVVLACSAAGVAQDIELPSPASVIEARALLDMVASRTGSPRLSAKAFHRYPHLKPVVAQAKKRCAAGRADACADAELNRVEEFLRDAFDHLSPEVWLASGNGGGEHTAGSLLSMARQCEAHLCSLVAALPVWSPLRLEQIVPNVTAIFNWFRVALVSGEAAVGWQICAALGRVEKLGPPHHG